MRDLMIMFDLEATVVDSWNSACPLWKKISYMSSWISSFVATDRDYHRNPKYGVFSFAVDHPHEREAARNMAAHTGKTIEFDDKWVPCWSDFEALVNLRPDLQKWEIVNLYGKDKMFDLWTRQFPDTDFILFDDCLPDKDSTTIRDGQMVRKIRV